MPFQMEDMNALVLVGVVVAKIVGHLPHPYVPLMMIQQEHLRDGR